MAAPAHAKDHPSIGPYRRIRLHGTPNAYGYYEIRWADARFDYHTKTESTATKVYHEAQAAFRRFLDDRRAEDNAVAAAPAAQTVERLCLAWIDENVERGDKHKTHKSILGRVCGMIGHLPVGKLDRAVLIMYGVDSRAQGRGPGTIQRDLSALRTVLNWAADKNLIGPADVPSFKKMLPAGGPPRDRFLDPDQKIWFWDQAMAWHHEQVRMFAAIGLETAARREAILELEWNRVNLRLGQIDFRKPGRPETKKRRPKAMRISRRLRPILEDAARRAPKDATGRPTGLVLAGMSASGLDAAFHKFTTTIGVPWVRPHVLRHTWASCAAMSGKVSLTQIAEFMCDDIKTVVRNYTHLLPGHMDEAANFDADLGVPALRVVPRQGGAA